MIRKYGNAFGAVVAYILLLLYAGAVFYMIKEVIDCASNAACKKKDFTEGMIHVVTIIGGLYQHLLYQNLQ